MHNQCLIFWNTWVKDKKVKFIIRNKRFNVKKFFVKIDTTFSFSLPWCTTISKNKTEIKTNINYMINNINYKIKMKKKLYRHIKKQKWQKHTTKLPKLTKIKTKIEKCKNKN